MNALTGKVAVITGAASGMGKAAAKLFAAEGANVVLADLNAAGGEEAAAAASAGGSRCVFQRADVASEPDVAVLVARALAEFGRLDIMFNNAGIGGAVGPIDEINVDDWDRSLAVCLRGVFLGIKHAVAPMRAQGGGAIISTASIAGVGGIPFLHAYGASKAAIINLTRSASIELAPDRIRVNCIAPGAISTPIVYGGPAGDKKAFDERLVHAQPLPVAGQAEDIANAALFLASDAARFVTGHTLVVDGGATAGAHTAGPSARTPPSRRFAGPSFEI